MDEKEKLIELANELNQVANELSHELITFVETLNKGWGYKESAKRIRKKSIEFEKSAKEFRRLSVEFSKKAKIKS